MLGLALVVCWSALAEEPLARSLEKPPLNSSLVVMHASGAPAHVLLLRSTRTGRYFLGTTGTDFYIDPGTRSCMQEGDRVFRLFNVRGEQAWGIVGSDLSVSGSWLCRCIGTEGVSGYCPQFSQTMCIGQNCGPPPREEDPPLPYTDSATCQWTNGSSGGDFPSWDE